MNLFRIAWPIKRRLVVDLGYHYWLPELACRVCTPEFDGWGNNFEYPAFQFDFLNTRQFNVQRVVSLTQFERIRARIVSAAGRYVRLIPGACIGEMSGKSVAKDLDDFIWGRVTVPQISRRAKELLESEGIRLLTAEFRMFCPGRREHGYLAIQLEPVTMMTKESLAAHKILHCSRCGNFAARLQPRPVVPEGYIVKRSAWPEGQDLVQMEETMRVLASEKFMEAVRKHNLTGIRFIPCGQLV